jgi:hypothetical protein
MVHENIIPGIAPDKTVAFFVIKPFNYALFFHFSSSLPCFNAFASLLREAQRFHLIPSSVFVEGYDNHPPDRPAISSSCRKDDPGRPRIYMLVMEKATATHSVEMILFLRFGGFDSFIARGFLSG